jgi:hypothetical protein
MALDNFQRSVVQVLAMKIGPAAEDVARDICNGTGTPLEQMKQGQIEAFIGGMPAILSAFMSPGDLKECGEQLRKLK